MSTPSEGFSPADGHPLTASAWGALAVAVGLVVVGGGIFGLAEFTGLGIALALTVTGAFLSVRLRHVQVRCVRRAVPQRVFAGDTLEIAVEVTNTGRGHAPSLTVHDRLAGTDTPEVEMSATMPPLAPGETATTTRKVRLERRGRVTIGPVALSFTDPFGLGTRSLPGAASVEFTVLPRIEPVAPPLFRVDAEYPSAVPVASASGTEYASLRAYVPGDDVRKVHWRTSARLDDLVVRQDERPLRPGCTVVLDTRADVHDEQSFERVISIAASIVVAAIAADMRVRLCTTAGFDSAIGSDRNRLDVILGELAILQPAAGSHASAPHGSDPTVAISTPAGLPSLGVPLNNLSATVLATTARRGPDERVREAVSGEFGAIIVSPNISFAALWNNRFSRRPNRGPNSQVADRFPAGRR